MFIRRAVALAVALWVASVAASSAQQNDPREILRTLNFRSGSIPLGNNLATISLTPDFRFLNNLDTQTFLTKVYTNPPGTGRNALGLIIPTDVNPLSRNGWVAVVQYANTGHVSDSDASGINYDDLLRQMQEQTAKSNEQRVKDGYQRIELIGWAQTPHYDANSKKLYWAKHLHFGDSRFDTLNYEIRILGRGGVLDVNIVGEMDILPSINQRLNTILGMIQFNKGSTYAEFNPSIDKAAAYGIAGLIAGGVLTKVGFFKALLVVLAASWKLVGAVVVAAFATASAFIKRLFSRKPRPANSLTPPNTPPAQS